MKAAIEALAVRFPSGAIGSDIRFLETIDSTNRLALDLPVRDSPHGLVLVAGKQTAGRGRQGRSWLSLPGVGLHFTVVLRPDDSARQTPLLTLTGALAVYDALKGFCNSPLDIRWPNDVLLAGGKVSGILGEAAFRGDKLERAVLGISVNVGHKADDFPQGMPSKPISILMAEGRAPAIPELLEQLLQCLNKWYRPFAAGETSAILAAVRNRSSFVSGKRLRVESGGDVLAGTSAGLGDDGCLRLRLASGIEIELLAGDVRVLGE
jgi:BirA family biotin operon repressor/biotin-[acetyl-CoA-carboxylase] ligase